MSCKFRFKLSWVYGGLRWSIRWFSVVDTVVFGGLQGFYLTLEEIDLLPPPLRRLPGRPKKSRRREKDEAPPSDVRRKLSTIKCTNCGQLGHNKRSCQRAPIKAKEKKQGASTSASQTSTRREIQEYASVQAKAKSQLNAKRTKRYIRENQASKAPPNPTTQESMTERSDARGVANVF
ncbi:uncharacterized protein G2W53_029501 [Senna tora]|uniref:CCHC-type domain-containing protein n=1 Tax=Senna tora TaxID=362788 RepID=A0A834T5C2_9FABA|nr:uncharacterized protein G2W53_029501 [Senna tora]